MADLTIPPLRPFQFFTDGDGRLTKTGYDFLYNLYLRVGGSLDALNAVTLVDKTWDAPNPIGTTTPDVGKFTTLTANTTLIVNGGVTATGSGLKHVRITTGSIAAGATALITHTWATTFADANYTVSAEVQDATAAVLSLEVVHIETKTAGAVGIRVKNTSAGALTGTLHIIAIHD